jgi:hypothetical protein
MPNRSGMNREAIRRQLEELAAASPPEEPDARELPDWWFSDLALAALVMLGILAVLNVWWLFA